jgi:hypothetical protein
MPDALRAKLVDLMVRLAKQKIDWSTFSAGWQITQPDPSKITMVGDGIAIRNAQLTATARAANNMTATAEAAANMTKTAQANQTATAKADAARSAAMTATAAAIPTKTPVPPTATATATATPPPTAISGTITGSGGGSISINPGGGAPAATYQVDGSAAITRDGAGSTIDALKKGDAVNLTVDFNKIVTRITATPAPAGGMNPALALVVLVPVLAAVVAWLLLKSRGIGEAFVIKRVSAA